MREDMSKVIVERPRHKPWRISGRKPRSGDESELPAFSGMTRCHQERHGYKTLNENLAPLKRYLFKQVGRPWNKVYAEISEHLRADNPVQQHVRDHLKDFVAVKPRRDIDDWSRRWARAPWWQPLYVHPDTGLLCRTDRLPEVKAARRAEANKPKPAVDRIVLAAGFELRRIDGLWYEVRMAPLPKAEFHAETRIVTQTLGYGRKARSVKVERTTRRLVTPGVRDIVTGKLVYAGPWEDDERSWRQYRYEHRERCYAIAKRSLSRRELKLHGLIQVQ